MQSARRIGIPLPLQVVGASFLSAAGSLSLHVAPIVTLVLISDERASAAGAGWLRALAQMSEMAISLALPMLGFAQLSRRVAFLGALALTCGITLSASREGAVLLSGWVLIGLGSGSLKHLGIQAAANAPDKALAFTLRLALILLLAGAASALFVVLGATSSFDSLVLQLTTIIAVALLVGLALYRPVAEVETFSQQQIGPATVPYAHRPVVVQYLGLVVVYIYFIGATGAITYALHQAVGRGMVAIDVVWILAGTKAAAGVVLLLHSLLAPRPEDRQLRLWIVSVIASGATLGMYLSLDNVTLFASILIWEISANLVSARMQAAVVQSAPMIAGRWLNVVALFGGATGPAVNGVAISAGADSLFVMLALFTTFVPALWHAFTKRISW